jgi:hypothetical protein
VLSGDQTGVQKMAPLTGGVTCRSPVPSGWTTHAWGMRQFLHGMQLVNAIRTPFGDHWAESAPTPGG